MVGELRKYSLEPVLENYIHSTLREAMHMFSSTLPVYMLFETTHYCVRNFHIDHVEH